MNSVGFDSRPVQIEFFFALLGNPIENPIGQSERYIGYPGSVSYCKSRRLASSRAEPRRFNVVFCIAAFNQFPSGLKEYTLPSIGPRPLLTALLSSPRGSGRPTLTWLDRIEVKQLAAGTWYTHLSEFHVHLVHTSVKNLEPILESKYYSTGLLRDGSRKTLWMQDANDPTNRRLSTHTTYLWNGECQVDKRRVYTIPVLHITLVAIL